jgi:dienelactone hydrolase
MTNSTNNAAIKTSTITYLCGDKECKGYLAVPAHVATTSKVPAVLIVPEWWGLNDYPRSRANQLAKHGYIAFAVDMYGEGKTADNPEEAGQLMTAASQSFNQIINRFKSGYTTLLAQPGVDPKSIVGIGYCFGGGVVVNAARLGTEEIPLRAVVSYHGIITAPKDARYGISHPKISVFTGSADPFFTLEQIEDFKKELKDRNLGADVVILEGLQHAFTNPEATRKGEEFGTPLKYDKKGDEVSWEATLSLLEEVFKK